MRFVIVTGMSGAGKSTALKTLEDMGFFCVDNLPVMLIKKFAEIAHDDKLQVDNVAIGVDIRSGEALGELSECLQEMKENNYSYEILFLDSNEAALVKRYKETRRKHPLSKTGRINEGIVKERQKIEFLKQRADYIIDTSNLLTRELKVELDKIFVNGEDYNNIIITVMSFGFKYGIPRDSDLVYDVRFLPNPYYDLELRPLTGNDEAVVKVVSDCDEYKEFMEKLTDMVKFLLPFYKKEGKSQLVISIGCTGGKHRSVTVVNDLSERLKELPYTVRNFHRDITKDRIVKGE
ncbi:MAG: RNase adapter RapZ [Lachnospiraceae bacterium]|nr:RNase adapter RapZ [Lachnospiraceae bacterium]